jgi:GAF domain-containing protein
MGDMKQNVYTRALWRALEMVGGKEALRRAMHVPMRELDDWLEGRVPPPMEAFLTAVDIISLPTPRRSPHPATKRVAELKLQTRQLIQASQDAVLEARTLRDAGPPPRDGLPRVRRFLDAWFGPSENEAMLESALGAALEAGDAPMGNVQLQKPDGLHIVASVGFERPFLEFFACVQEGQWGCGSARRLAQRTIIADVANDPRFAGTDGAAVMEAAGARACQSTPLVATTGVVLGVLSTHYREPGIPPAADFAVIDRIARRTAFWLEQASVS